MFLKKYFLPLLRNHLRVAKVTGTVAYKYSKIEPHVRPYESKRRRFIEIVECIQFVINTFLFAVSVYLNRKDPAQKYQGLFFFNLWCIWLFVRYDFRLKVNTKPMAFINTFIKFEQKFLPYDKKQKTPTEVIIWWLTLNQAEFGSIPFTSVFIGILLIVNPCACPFTLSLLPICRTENPHIPIPYRIVHIAYEVFTAIHVAFGGTVCLAFTVIAPATCLAAYFNILKKRIEEATSAKDLQKTLKWYRVMSIVGCLYNDCNAARQLPAVIWGVPGMQILASYVCLTNYRVIKMPGFLVFPILFANALVVNVAFITYASWVYTHSVKVRATWKNCLSKRKPDQIAIREFWASPPVKVGFAQNFVDRCTALVISDFCMSQTVSLMLTTKGGRGG